MHFFADCTKKNKVHFTTQCESDQDVQHLCVTHIKLNQNEKEVEMHNNKTKIKNKLTFN